VAKQFNDYKDGGRAKQIKVPKLIKFNSLKDSLAAPELVISDYAKFERPAQYHALWQALHKFVEQKKRLPKPRNDEDAAMLRKLLPEGSGEVEEKLLKAFSYQATGSLCPMASFIGGVAAQEAMKAVTHHMSPIKQFFYFDALEALPGDYSAFDESKLTEEMCAPVRFTSSFAFVLVQPILTEIIG
jgi:ubiquitin-activating enzyme E1